MVSTKLFNFAIFKNVMEIPDLEEVTYSFILRDIFSYLKKVHAIDIDATLTTAVSATSTTTSIVVPYSAAILEDQIIRIGGEESIITGVVNDVTANTSTITVSPAFSIAPSVTTAVTIMLTVIEFDLQYAIYQHAKFLFETQKRNAFVVETVTDATGNKATYKAKPPMSIYNTYLEYSPNAIALL